MKTKLVLLLVAILPLAARAADDLSTALQKGLFEEEANQNLPAAIKAYESLLATSDEQRKLAATALFRLGECYRKLGRTNDAVAQYQRLLRDYTEQETLATLSRQNLRGLGVSPVLVMPESQNVSGDVAAMSSEAKLRLKGLLQNEIAIAERFAKEQRKRIEAGTLPVGDAIRFERDVLGLKRQLVAVEGLSSSADRSDWQRLVQEEIKLAEDAVAFEQKKLESGRSTAGEVARLQRDVLTLKRELVMFENTAARVSPVVRKESVPVSAEAEELARTERILVQLEGRDLSQVRRLLPTLVPDADFECYDRMLAEAQEKIENCRAGKLNCTEEEERKLAQTADQSKARLQQRAAEVKSMLLDRIANLRAQVKKQGAETSATQAGVRSGAAALTPAQIEAQRLLIERLELEIKTAETEIERGTRGSTNTRIPSIDADKLKAKLLELRRQLILARNGNATALSVSQESLQPGVLLKQLQSLSRSELVNVLPTVVSDPLLNSLLEQLSQAGRKHVELETKFGSAHPDVKANRTALEVLERQIYDRTEGIMKGLTIKAAALKQSVGRDSVEP